MKPFRSLLLPAALSLTLIAPIAACAQQANQPPAQDSTQTQSQYGRHGHHGRHGFMRMLRGVNLSDQQKTQIRQIVEQFRQSHPRGSRTDPQARRQAREQLRRQVMNVLTPAQRAQVQKNVLQMRASRANGGTGAGNPQ